MVGLSNLTVFQHIIRFSKEPFALIYMRVVGNITTCNVDAITWLNVNGPSKVRSERRINKSKTVRQCNRFLWSFCQVLSSTKFLKLRLVEITIIRFIRPGPTEPCWVNRDRICVYLFLQKYCCKYDI